MLSCVPVCHSNEHQWLKFPLVPLHFPVVLRLSQGLLPKGEGQSLADFLATAYCCHTKGGLVGSHRAALKMFYILMIKNSSLSGSLPPGL